MMDTDFVWITVLLCGTSGGEGARAKAEHERSLDFPPARVWARRGIHDLLVIHAGRPGGLAGRAEGRKLSLHSY